VPDFVAVATVAGFPDPGQRIVEVDDRILALFRVGDDFYCIDDICTHDGGPLAEGKWCDTYAIACPRHGARFDIRTGKALTMPATADTACHEVRVVDGQVFVKLRDA
jgi:3-phenylpropionate/trans-cinnamate dioxygenase ferredoxin subunit